MDALNQNLAGELLLVGMSHHSAPLDLRERCAVEPTRIADCLASLRAIEGVEECFVLSTCNRTEVLVAGRIDERAEHLLANLFFRDAKPHQRYAHRGLHGVIHMFRVAAGLDSVVLGESQILAQIKDATAAARTAGSLGRLLAPLVDQSLSVGRRIRNETAIGLGTLSVARVAIDIARHVFGTFESTRALVIGAGETGVLVAQHLSEQSVGTLLFANRTLERAQAAAQRFGAGACTLDQVPQLLEQVDLVVACVDGAGKLIGADQFPRRMQTRDRPLLAIDLSVPRAIDAAVAKRSGLLYYDLDDLARVVDRNQQERIRATAGSHEILVAEVHKYLSLRSYAAAAPSIAELRARFDELREATLDEVLGAQSTPEDVRLAHELTRRLMDATLAHLKDTFKRARRPEDLDREYQRYLASREREEHK
ncbi:MAG: glutamyl-tRNA reductase [Planctomycetaceae bacterium]|nr:glutamyl-tRNA reductase [Planctomycetaceae bacterium]